MAVPSITRVLPFGSLVGAPVEGNTAGGALVEIYGGGFRVRAPQAFGETFPAPVQVLFAGASASVSVIRSNLLRVVTPPSPLAFTATRAADSTQIGYQGHADVTVTNVDDTGVPIPGETVTLTDGYTFVLPRIGDPGSPNVTVQVTDAFIQVWKRAVISNVMTDQSVFFQSSPRDARARNIGRPELPAVVLIGPRTVQDRQYEPAHDPVASEELLAQNPQEAGLFGMQRYPSTESYAWDVLGMSNDLYTLLNLKDVASNFIRQAPHIVVPRDASDPSGPTISYDLDWEDLTSTFSVDPEPSDSDLQSFRGSVILRGVRVENTGLPGDGLVLVAPAAETIEIDYDEGTPGVPPLASQVDG